MNELLRRYFGTSLAAAIILALAFPYAGWALNALATPLLFLLMFITGVLIDWKRAGIVFQKPLMILAGSALLYLGIPSLMVLLANVLLQTDQYIYGIIFAALTPGAIVAPFLTRALGGDTEISFGVLVSSMLLSPLLIPPLLILFSGDGFTIPASILFQDILLLVPVPILLAFALVKAAPRVVRTISANAPVLNFFVLGLLVFILFGGAVTRLNPGYGFSQELGILILLGFVQDFGLLAFARAFFPVLLRSREGKALIISSSMNNIAVAASILLLYDPRAAIAPSLGFVAHAFLFTPAVLSLFFRKLPFSPAASDAKHADEKTHQFPDARL